MTLEQLLCIRPHICSFMYCCITRPLIVSLRPFYLCYNVSALLFLFGVCIRFLLVGNNYIYYIHSQRCEFGLGPLHSTITTNTNVARGMSFTLAWCHMLRCITVLTYLPALSSDVLQEKQEIKSALG